MIPTMTGAQSFSGATSNLLFSTTPTSTTPSAVLVIQAKSAGFNAGNKAEISINDEPVRISSTGGAGTGAHDQRGLHLVIVSPEDG